MKKIQAILPWPLLIVFILGVLLRFVNLGSIFLYFDEPIHSVRIDYQPLPFVLAHNNGSALFAVLVHFLLGLGKTEFMARLPSAILGSLSILAIYMLGATLFSRREGLVAAALLAFSPFCIQFSQYSRGYATFMFLAILSLFFFVKAHSHNQKKDWIAYIAFTALAIYAHLTGFLILFAYSLFVALMWLKTIWRPSQSQERKQQTQRLIAFALSTGVVIIVLFLLYLPDENLRGFLSASVSRVKTALPFSYLFPYLSQKILTAQLQVQNSSLWLWFSAILLGFIAALFHQWKKSLLLFLYLLLPFLIFIRINPREVNIQSADRYFVFVLPVLLLLAARGLTLLVAGFSAFMNQFKFFKLPKKTVSGIAILVLTVLFISQFRLGYYYLYFWRFGSYHMPPEVWNCLQENAKQDGLIHLDSFPAGGHILALNILTRSPQVRGSEAVIRKSFLASSEDQKIMIFRSAGTLQTELNSEIGVWVVSRFSDREKNILFPYLKTQTQAHFWDLKAHTLLFFQQPEASLGQNVINMCTAFMQLDRGNFHEKQYLLMRARAHVLLQMYEKAYQDLASARALSPIASDLPISHTSLATAIMDRIFALDKTAINQVYWDYFFNRYLANLLFLEAEQNLNDRLYPEAIQAYQTCLLLSREFDQDIPKRFFRIANVYFINENYALAYALYQETVNLNPNRIVAALLLAEAAKHHVSSEKAAEVYQQALALDSSSSPLMTRLLREEPLVLIQVKDSRWRVIFQGSKKNTFSGEIKTKKPLKQVQRELFKKEDGLELSPQSIRFEFKMDKRKFKTLEFQASEDSMIDFDIRINSGHNPLNVILLGQGVNPQSIPFSLSEEMLKSPKR